MRSVSTRVVVASGFASSLAAILAATANSIIISRSFGPSGKGEFAVAMSLGSTLAVILSLGLEAGVMNFAGGDSRIAQEQARSAALVCAFVTPIATAITFVALANWNGLTLSRLTSFILALGVATTISAGPAVALLRVQGRQHSAQWLASAYVIAPMTFSAVAGWRSHSVDVSVDAAAVGYLCVSSVAYAYIASSTRDSSLTPGWRTLVRYSLIAHTGAVLYVVTSRAPILILGWFGSTDEAGLFSVANSLAELSLVISQSLLSWTLAKAASDPLSYRVLRKSVSFNVLGTTTLLAGTVLVAPLAIPLLFGPQFNSSWQSLVILSPGILAISVWRLVSYDLSVRGHARARLLSAGAGSFVMLIGVLVHVQYAASAAVLTSIAYSAMTVCVAFAVPTVRRRTRALLAR